VVSVVGGVLAVAAAAYCNHEAQVLGWV